MSKTTQLIDLIQHDPTIYNNEENKSSSSENINQAFKSGYLNLRTSYVPFISKWDRYYFCIQNGSLIYQNKNDIAGTPIIDLKSDLVIIPTESDDRRFVFQINSLSNKKSIILQANSEKDRVEWIKILGNIVKDDSRTKIMNYKSSSSSDSAPKK